MSPRTVTSLEELRALVGTEIGTSGWLLIDQDRVDQFAAATGDHQWIHVDPQRAASSPFGGTIAHGYLTLSVLPALAQEILRIEFGSARLNYGVNSVRFPAPLRTGSRVRATATLVDLKSLPKGEQLTTRYTVQAEGSDRPACVAESLTLIVR